MSEYTNSLFEVHTRLLADLKPNGVNRTLFPITLGYDSICRIAKDLRENTQRVPLEITPEGTILDGERRYLGLLSNGEEEAFCVVVVEKELSDSEIEKYILDCYTSVRERPLREMVNVFVALLARLKGDRCQGRISGESPEISTLRETAARKAGFSSLTLVERAQAVFRRGSPETIQSLEGGEISISAAYATLKTSPKGDVAQGQTQRKSRKPGPTEQAVTSKPVAQSFNSEAAGGTSDRRAEDTRSRLDVEGADPEPTDDDQGEDSPDQEADEDDEYSTDADKLIDIDEPSEDESATSEDGPTQNFGPIPDQIFQIEVALERLSASDKAAAAKLADRMASMFGEQIRANELLEEIGSIPVSIEEAYRGIESYLVDAFCESQQCFDRCLTRVTRRVNEIRDKVVMSQTSTSNLDALAAEGDHRSL